ncbi:hypothetical protein GC170_07395 [bacterium]|nr:hypothetical protein [bacterium]
MNQAIVRWVPRVLGIAFASFLAMFALDVFDEGLGVGATIVALAIHLIPTWLVLAAVAIAWKHQVAGAALFFLLAAAYVAMAGSRFPASTILLIAGPPVVIGVLFLISSRSTRAHQVSA